MTAELRERPRSAEELGAMLAGLTPSAQQAAAFRPLDPRPGDVVITPFGKCGTTMLQQMFHQLRMAGSGGDMDFDDISRVVPWLEMAILLPETDVHADQRAAPRGYKSHLHYEGLPKGMRYVVTLRDPHEAYMSMYHFFEGWLFEPGTIQPEAFMPIWARGGPSRVDYFTHLLSWWARRGEADTLVMDYRDVIANKRGAIGRLAALAQLPLSDATAALVEVRTSRGFMLEHKDRFDDHLMRHMNARVLGLPVESSSSKVRSEDARRVPIPPSIAQEIDAMWAERIAPVTGLANYAALAAELAL
ncbi:sulfotransferase domain-containing protein [Qipengyuania marisflavi]|uniref:Sulfotransferase domain-containing protein n=1 Tax=Qipengyuania marisflavi TaxID=2486356 RepID=A0A5S3P670_9SPHN|nr:sulfotransferase domain-containing protein [Qipengyuania marisflavi]TMM48436.1 sulfotransferase domain-containing protein [Qipengyuania marisflavi]